MGSAVAQTCCALECVALVRAAGLPGGLEAARGPLPPAREMVGQGLLLFLLLLLGGETGSTASADSNGAFQRCQRLEPDSSKWNGGMEDCSTCFQKYHSWQPCHLTARPKGSATLPCTFNYTWEATETAEVFWRLGDFHGMFIFNHTRNVSQMYTHPNYEGRVTLVGDLRNGLDASIRIENLQESDSDLYFCGVSIQTLHNGVQHWRSLQGTNFTVTGLPLDDTLSFVGLVSGAALGAAVVLGLLAFLTWRKGCCSRCPQKRRASAQSKEKSEGREYEEIPIKALKAPPPASPQPPARTPPPLAPKDSGGLLYADLNLAGSRGRKPPSQAPERERGEETTYAVLRH